MDLNIWSWNVNGLRAVLGKSFLQEVQKASPDILCLQETKLQEHQIPDEISDLDGYHAHWSHAQKKGYSGTVTFSREKPLTIEYGIGVDEFDSEGRIVITEYDQMILFNIYFPNGKRDDERLDYKLRFYDRALEVMQQKRSTGKMVLVTGDYNTAHHDIDLANPRENEKESGFLPIERAWLDKIVKLGWVDTFRLYHPEPERYSWWSYRAGARPRNIGWRIDYFFVDQDHRNWVTDADIRDDIMGSDHCPVTVRVTLP
jgi:exodeoxyribonuclease-3